jgi:hypothetical protein
MKTFLHTVEEILYADNRRSRYRNNHLNHLVELLEKKENQLEHQLSETTDKRKRSRLELEIRITKAQREKGASLIAEA